MLISNISYIIFGCLAGIKNFTVYCLLFLLFEQINLGGNTAGSKRKYNRSGPCFFTLTSGCIGRQKKERKKTKREVGRCCDSWAIEEGSNAITSGKKFLTTFFFNV